MLMKHKCEKWLLVTVLLIAALPLWAQNGVRLSMTFRNETLPAALLRLEQSSCYKFLFTYEDVSQYRVNGTVKDATLFQIVDFVLRDKPLHYTVNGKFINIVKGRKDPDKAETGKMQTVGGYVYDAKTKEPVIGAQVKVLGSNVVTVTDINGAFTFDYYLSGGQQLQVSYMGMQTKVVPLKKQMNIAMEEDTKTLKDVVVTGIFRKAKESYTGAVTTVGKEKLEMYRGTNLLQTLKNVDASLNFPINNAAGSNPNVLPNLNIRGSSTLPMNVEEFNENAAQTVNTPLIILDGFEISLTKLMDYNDDQIESINILKDAAATAIYGSRGANGVIVVVTKQPKEGKLRVTAKAGLSLEIPDLSTYHLLNASQKLQLEKSIGLYDPDYLDDKVRYASYYNERLQNVLNGVDIDWLHKPVRTGVGQNYNVRLNGGASAFRWAASLGYNDVQGAMKGSSRKNLNGDITLMYSVNNLIFRNYTSVTSNHAKESKYGSFQDYVDMEPYDNPYDANGNLVKTFYDYAHSSSLIGNPLYDASLNTINKSEYFTFINNFSVEWQIIEGLRLRAKLGVTTTRNSSDYFLPAEHSYFSSTEYQTASGQLRKGMYTYGTGNDNLMSADVTASYTRTFADKHQLYVGLDYSLSDENAYAYSFTAEGFSNADLNLISNASQYKLNSAPTGDRTKTRLVGLTGNANYTYEPEFGIS